MDAANPVFSLPRVKPLCTEDLDWALARGWDDFKTMRGDLVLLPFIYVAAGLAAAFFAFNADLIRLIFPLVAGFALVGPAAAAGFYEIARRREAGEVARWQHFLDPLNGRARVPLLTLTAMLAVLFLAWIVAADVIYRYTLGTLGTLDPTTPISFLDSLPTREGVTMIIVGYLVGALFATITLAVAAFSFPMVVDKGCDAVTAVTTSVRAFLCNPLDMILWGIRVAAILALAALPLLVGLMVALPVLGYATWHLYTRAVQR